MSRLSVHYTNSSNRTGFGEFLRVAQPAFVYSLNGNIRNDVDTYSPDTKIIYRRQSDGWQRLPDNFFNDNPTQNATRWLTVKPKGESTNLLGNWSMNHADYYDPLNEPSIELPPNPTDDQIADMIRKATYLNTWMITALEIAHQYGYKLALFSFPFGSPPFQVWKYLLPAMRLGKKYGAILSLHAYTESGGMLQYNPDGSFTQNTLYWTLRHREIYSKYVPVDAQLPIVYTEASSSNGYDVELSGQAWIDDIGAYDTELFKDDYIAGICGFQLGGNESNLVGILSKYATYIQEHPTTEVPPEEEMLNIVVIENLVPPDTTKTEMDYVVNQTFPAKQDVQWSADTAKYLAKAGLPGSKIIVWNPERWTQGDIIAYLGVATEIKRFPESNFRLTNPVPSIPFRVTSKFDTPRNYANGRHEGLDLDGYDDTTGQTVPVVACAGGKVTTVYNTATPNSYGKYVVIDHENGYKTWYCHLSSTTVLAGQSVIKGQKVGVTGATGTNSIHLHLNLQHIGQGASGYFVPDVVDPLPYIDYTSVVPPVITDTHIGLGYGNQDEIPQSHADLYGRSFSGENKPAFLFLTLPDYNAMTRTIQKIKQKTPNAFFMARMFFSVGNTPFTPQDFVNYTHNGTSSAYNNGIRDFQVGNEWNIEGMNLNWSNGVQFGNWLKEVLAILKPRYPDARFWYPALSPNASSQTFLSESISTGVGDLLYGYCFHDYWWTESGGQYNMVDETGGLQHKKLHRVLPTKEQSKPISITEFSCNTPTVPNTEKGKQYRRYKSLLGQNGVHSAFSFVLNWATDNNKENWANSNGSSTGISEGFLSV